MPNKKEVEFFAKKKVPVPVIVQFLKKDGEKVVFAGHKKVVKPVKVDFFARVKN